MSAGSEGGAVEQTKAVHITTAHIPLWICNKRRSLGLGNGMARVGQQTDLSGQRQGRGLSDRFFALSRSQLHQFSYNFSNPIYIINVQKVLCMAFRAQLSAHDLAGRTFREDTDRELLPRRQHVYGCSELELQPFTREKSQTVGAS